MLRKSALVLLLGGSGSPLPAGVAIRGLPEPVPVVEGGRTLTLQVEADGPGGSWLWTVRGDGGAGLEPPEGPVTRFSVPLTPFEQVYVIEVRDGLDAARTAAAKVRAVPPRCLFQDILPSVLGEDWHRGDLALLVPGEPGPFPEARSVRFVDDPAMGRLYRGYLVLEGERVHHVDPAGGVRTLLGADVLQDLAERRLNRRVDDFRLEALAVLPGGSREAAPWKAVLLGRCGAPAPAGTPEPENVLLFALDAEGRPRVLAGRDPLPGAGECLPDHAPRGTLDAAYLHDAHLLDLDREGNLYLASRTGAVTRIQAGGAVHFHRSPPPPPPRGFRRLGGGPAVPAGGPTWLDAFGVDPGTGDLLFVQRGRIARLSPGWTGEAGGGPIPWAAPAGLGGARDLLLHQGRLFLAEGAGGRVVVFDPATGRLDEVVQASASGRVRPGPVSLAAPDLAPGGRGALPDPVSLCPGPDGTLTVLGRGTLAQVPGGLRLRPPGGPRAGETGTARPGNGTASGGTD